MVFVRASIGCEECRSKYTRCDGAMPACGRCVRRGLACPGYRHVGGFVFKDETNRLLRPREDRQLQHARRNPTLSAFDGKQPDRFATFFFNTYTLPGQSSSTSYGLLDHVTGSYRSASTSTALLRAANVLGATTFIFSRHIKDTDFAWYHEMRVSAIRSLSRDLQCKKTIACDDVLVAVLLLDFTEAIIQAHTGLKGSLCHREGILRLLQIRGYTNFQNAQALSLFNAAKHALLRNEVDSAALGNVLPRPDSVTLPAKGTKSAALRLLDVLECISTLQNILRDALSREEPLSYLAYRVHSIQKSLLDWEETLPAKCRPRTDTVVLSATPESAFPIERYESLDDAVMYNQWRCACLNMLRLRQTLYHTELLRPQESNDEEEHIMESIRRAVPTFLGYLHGAEYVQEVEATGAWVPVWGHHKQTACDTERFRGDYLGKWFLSDILQRVEQAIGSHDDLIPRLPVSDETTAFLREQRQILTDLPYQAHPEQLARVFK